MALTLPRITATLAATILLSQPGPARAQWLKYKTPDIPRMADGKPRLAAPAPRTPDGKPDFSGMWQTDSAKAGETSKSKESLKAQPWADALARKRQEELLRDDPSINCLPPGPQVEMGVGRVVQTPKMLVMLYNGTLYREVFLDGRPLPEIVNPTWMGYSVGHWDGDTLVIESAGFNNRTWIDGEGHPHTEALRVTERVRRPDFGHLEIQKMLVDPGALQEPWAVPLKLELEADTEPLEYVCNENERDSQHLVGKASDEKGIQVAAAILAKYVGSYELKIPGSTRIFTLEVSLSGDQLAIGGFGAAKTSLQAVSETEFSAPFGNLKFPKEGDGAAPYLTFQLVEGDIKAVRK
jgi:hypothetical protein